jgi:hypothetical protein
MTACRGVEPVRCSTLSRGPMKCPRCVFASSRRRLRTLLESHRPIRCEVREEAPTPGFPGVEGLLLVRTVDRQMFLNPCAERRLSSHQDVVGDERAAVGAMHLDALLRRSPARGPRPPLPLPACVAHHVRIPCLEAPASTTDRVLHPRRSASPQGVPGESAAPTRSTSLRGGGWPETARRVSGGRGGRLQHRADRLRECERRLPV